MRAAAREERQSSSGLVVATGTGATGWARSIQRDRKAEIAPPAPTEPALAFFVREAFPSVATGATLTEGRLAGEETLAIYAIQRMDREYAVEAMRTLRALFAATHADAG